MPRFMVSTGKYWVRQTLALLCLSQSINPDVDSSRTHHPSVILQPLLNDAISSVMESLVKLTPFRQHCWHSLDSVRTTRFSHYPQFLYKLSIPCAVQCNFKGLHQVLLNNIRDDPRFFQGLLEQACCLESSTLVYKGKNSSYFQPETILFSLLSVHSVGQNSIAENPELWFPCFQIMTQPLFSQRQILKWNKSEENKQDISFFGNQGWSVPTGTAMAGGKETTGGWCWGQWQGSLI